MCLTNVSNAAIRHPEILQIRLLIATELIITAEISGNSGSPPLASRPRLLPRGLAVVGLLGCQDVHRYGSQTCPVCHASKDAFELEAHASLALLAVIN